MIRMTLQDNCRRREEMAEQDERIPTNLRTMMILEELGKQGGARTAAEIGRIIGLPKQSAHRLCNTLISEGFLAKDEQGGGLRPGRRARLMASGILHASTSHVARHQILKALADQSGETVNFVVPEDQGMSYRDRVETDWPFRVQLPVGSHVPFHCTASGKTFLATLKKSERKRLVELMSLDRKTGNTITDPANLLDELQKISRQGYALDRQEFIEGMVAIAVPVRDVTGRYMASIGVHGPAQRFSPSRAEELAPIVTNAAEHLTHVLCDA
jgi:DNA-binding IclR family transcriptional regulator